MGRVFKIQTSSYTDQMTSDGAQLTKLPYPFIVHESGLIEYPKSSLVHRVVGFQKDLAKNAVDLSWRELMRDSSPVIGMYLVTANKPDKGKDDTWGVHDTAIVGFEELDKEAP